MFMRLLLSTLLTILLFGCGPNKELLMQTKFDAPLRYKVMSLNNAGTSEILSVFGKCTTPLNDSMQKALTRAGAQIQSANGEIFVARISSGRIFDVAALDFVMQLQLSQEARPLPQ